LHPRRRCFDPGRFGPASAGGVKGATVALKPTKAKPSGGVLGATTRLGGTVASTRLPFTGSRCGSSRWRHSR